MTEKRFDYTAYDDGTESIYDRKKDKYYFDMQLSEIEELMNELAEENEQLKQQVQKIHKLINSKIQSARELGNVRTVIALKNLQRELNGDVE